MQKGYEIREFMGEKYMFILQSKFNSYKDLLKGFLLLIVSNL